jgi:ditrans,polycis-polyprenyl diphosphate synthase
VQVTEELLAAHLSTAPLTQLIGPPDLLIRTSGEQRLSNYLLWDLAYTELAFEEVLWPDFGQEQFAQALRTYASRQRRFGVA